MTAYSRASACARSSPVSGRELGRQRPGRADAGVLVRLGELGGQRFRGDVRAAMLSSVRERHLFLAAVLADQADDDLGGAEALEGQQALVDVADLLDGQGAERDRAQLAGDGDGLDRAEHVQHGAVVDAVSGSQGWASGSNSEPSWAIRSQLGVATRPGRRR